MILLSLGTHRQAFSRALDLVAPLAREGRRLVIQHGSTPCRPRTPNTTWIEFMSYEEIVQTMKEADSVICHAGVGTIITALKSGHTPVVIPRQARHGEHVDDHQHEIAAQFAERGMVRCLTDRADLAALISPRQQSNDRNIGKGSAELRSAVANAAAARARTRRAVLASRRSFGP